MASPSCVGRRAAAAIPVAALALLIMAAGQPAQAFADTSSAGSLVAVKAPASSSSAAVKQAQVGQDTFSYTLDADGRAVIAGYEGSSSKLTVPTALDGVAVAGLGEGAFKGATGLAEVVVPDGVTSIASRAFEGCTALKSVDIAPTVTSIADDVFVVAVQVDVTQKDKDGNDQVVKQTEWQDIPGLTVLGDPESVAPDYAAAHGFTFVQNRFHATRVTLDNASLVLLNGLQTARLTGTVEPSNCTDDVAWSTSDGSVATVGQDGSVATAGLGSATVTLTAGKMSASCTVEVVQPVTQIGLNKAAVSMEAGDVKPLLATVLPNNAYNRNVVWSSSNPSVAKVDDQGNVTGVAQGKATITCAAVDGSGVTQSAQVEVVCNQHVATKASELASPHSYGNSTCDSWVYTDAGATGLALTFDERTYVERGYDFVEVYGADGSMVGRYTGAELAGATVKVPGDTVRVRLVSDSTNAEWGFAVTGVEEYQPDGWSFFDGAAHYYIGGWLLRGECFVGGQWRYFEPELGAMQTGLVTLANGTVKYYDENGLRVTGFVHLSDGTRYFSESDGAMATGLTYLPDGRVVYCGTDGILRSGTFTFKGESLHFNDNGVLDDPASTGIAAGTIAQEDGGPGPEYEAVADIQMLQRAVNMARDLVEADYTPESWAGLVAALASAQAVLDDSTASQTVVDAQTDLLNAAMAALEPAQPAPAPVEVDTTWLQQVVSDAQALSGPGYTPESWAMLKGALAAAQAVLSDGTASQSVVNAQAQLVQDAVDALVSASAPEPTPDPEPTPSTDLTELSNTMNEAWALAEADYTPESWANLQTVLAVAYEVLTDPLPTQQAVDEQTASVRAAIDALQSASAADPEPAPTPDPEPAPDQQPESDPAPSPDVVVDDPAGEDALEPVPDTSTDGGEVADEPADDVSDEDAENQEAAEYLGVLYLSALYQANLDDPDGSPVAFDQDGGVDLLVEPTSWPALAGNLIAQAATNAPFQDFLQAGQLDAANPLGLELYAGDDGDSVIVPVTTASDLVTGVTGDVSGDASYVAAAGLALSDDASFYTVVPASDYTVDADVAGVTLYDDGSIDYVLRLAFALADGSQFDRYFLVGATPDDASPFGWVLTRVLANSSLSENFA